MLSNRNLKTFAVVAGALLVTGFLESQLDVGGKLTGVLPAALDEHAETIAACLVGGVVVTAALVLTRGK